MNLTGRLLLHDWITDIDNLHYVENDYVNKKELPVGPSSISGAEYIVNIGLISKVARNE